MALDRELVGAALPGYAVGGEIGRGAWGVVLEGRHRTLGRPVAIKQLPRAFAADPAVQARFTAEATLVASLDHPHIVPVYDYVEREGLCLIVMERLTGGTLWERAIGRGLAADEACAVMLAVSSALEHAHGKGVLHRDVKPENVMFAGSGTVKLTDFGIAKVLTSAGAGLTAAGTVVGTPTYMSPEQAMGRPLGPPTDVFAAGVVLYEILSGQLPFPEEREPMAELYQRANGRARPLREVAPDVPPALAQVVDRALARDVEDRFGTAESFAVALAGATAAAYGAGWLQRAGVPVLASTAVLAAAERGTDDALPVGRRTIVTSPPHARLGAVEPAGQATPTAAPLHPLPGVVPSEAPSTPDLTPPPPEPPVPPAAPAQPEPPATGQGARRRWLLAMLAVVALLAAATAALTLGRDGDGGSDAPRTSQPAGEALTEAERDAFLTRCRSGRGTPAQCRCALDRLVSGRPADEAAVDVRSALRATQSEGLPAAVVTALASCGRTP